MALSPSAGCLPAPLRAGLSALGRSTHPIFLPATVLRVFPLPQATFPLVAAPHPQPNRIFTPAPPHVPPTEPFSHSLVPGITSEGEGLLSNLSGPTHSEHRAQWLADSCFLSPRGAGQRRAASRKSAGWGGVESASQKDSIWEAGAGPRGPRAGPGDLHGPMSVGFAPCRHLFSSSCLERGCGPQGPRAPLTPLAAGAPKTDSPPEEISFLALTPRACAAFARFPQG